MTLPSVPESFYWTQSPCGPVLKCRPLDSVADHAFTTRELQLSSADGWRRIGDLLGVAAVVTSNQVHGRGVATSLRGSPRAPVRHDADVYACGLCTAMHLGVFTSYRAEKENAGRTAAVVRVRAPLRCGLAS